MISHVKYLIQITCFLMAVSLTMPISAQKQKDTALILRRNPVVIADTVNNTNLFAEAKPVTLRVQHVKNNLVISFTQESRHFTLSFHEEQLKNNFTYNINAGTKGSNEVEAFYSSKSGKQISNIIFTKGKVIVKFDTDKKMWHLEVTCTMKNHKVKTEFFVIGDCC